MYIYFVYLTFRQQTQQRALEGDLEAQVCAVEFLNVYVYVCVLRSDQLTT